MFPLQIHIVFNSREDERITKPILEGNPKKVYYFTAFLKKTGQKDANMEFYEKNTSILKDKIPSLEIITKPLDYTDYIEIIQELSKIIKEEKQNNQDCQIYINASSGSKMTSLASIEASKLWGCEIYYVFSEKYDPEGTGALHKGEMFVIKPTTFPIKKPKSIYVQVLKVIEELMLIKYKDKEYDITKKKFIFKKQLLEELAKRKIIELKVKNPDKRKRQASIYMKGKNILVPLEKELNYIHLSDDKRNIKITLTQTGKDILDIFRYYF